MNNFEDELGQIETSGEGERYLEFDLGEEHYAIRLLLVREVIPIPETTAIPKAPAYFLGIMNLRGHVISIIDLRKKLGITSKEVDQEEAVIIVDVEGVQVGVIVDSINKVLPVYDKDVSVIPEVNSQVNTKFIEGICRQENHLVALIDLSKVLDIKTLGMIGNKAAA